MTSDDVAITVFSRVVLVSVLLFLVVPLATAQVPTSAPPVEINVQPDTGLPNGLLRPETGQAIVEVAVSVGCMTPPPLAPTQIRFAVDSNPDYATAILNPPVQTIAIAPENCLDSSYRQTVWTDVIVTTTRDAPAGIELATTVTATLTNEGRDFGPYFANFTLMNDYVPLTIVSPRIFFVKAEPNSKVVFPIDIENAGNGPTVISLVATEQGPEKLASVEVGADVRLESRAHKGSQALHKQTRNIEIQAPESEAYMNAIYQFEVRFASRYDGTIDGVDAKSLETDEKTAALAVQVQGGGVVGAPGLEFAAVILTIAFVLWIRRP